MINNGWHDISMDGTISQARYLISNIGGLNDYEIVEIRRDKSADYGYSFEVKKCVPPPPAFGLDKSKPAAS